MAKTIDFDQRYTEVRGRGRLAFMQDGHGFDARGNHLGRCNDQGELLNGAAPEAPAADEASPFAEYSPADLRAMLKEAEVAVPARANKDTLVALADANLELADPAKEAANGSGEGEGEGEQTGDGEA